MSGIFVSLVGSLTTLSFIFDWPAWIDFIWLAVGYAWVIGNWIRWWRQWRMN